MQAYIFLLHQSTGEVTTTNFVNKRFVKGYKSTTKFTYFTFFLLGMFPPRVKGVHPIEGSHIEDSAPPHNKFLTLVCLGFDLTRNRAVIYTKRRINFMMPFKRGIRCKHTHENNLLECAILWQIVFPHPHPRVHIRKLDHIRGRILLTIEKAWLGEDKDRYAI